MLPFHCSAIRAVVSGACWSRRGGVAGEKTKFGVVVVPDSRMSGSATTLGVSWMYLLF